MTIKPPRHSAFKYLTLWTIILINLCSCLCTPTIDQGFFDVSKMLQKDWKNSNTGNLSEVTVNIVQSLILSPSPFLFIETDFEEPAFQKLGMLSRTIDDILGNAEKNSSWPHPGVLVSFRYHNTVHKPNFELVIHKYIIGFSFEYMRSRDSTKCLVSSIESFPTSIDINNWPWASNTPYFSRTFQTLFDSNITILSLGITTNTAFFKCRVLANHITKSDVLVVNLPLKINQNFIGSYAYFKDEMKKQTNEISKTLTPVVIERQGYLMRPYLELSENETKSLQIRNKTTGESNEVLFAKFQRLLNTYIKLWIVEENNDKFRFIQEVVVISSEANKLNKSNKNYEQNHEIIFEDKQTFVSYLANIREADYLGYYDLCSLRAIMVELIESGFDTIVLSPRLLKGLFVALKDDSSPLLCSLISDMFPRSNTTHNYTLTVTIFVELDLQIFDKVIHIPNFTRVIADLSDLLKVHLILSTFIMPHLMKISAEEYPIFYDKFTSFASGSSQKFTPPCNFACIAHTALFDKEEASTNPPFDIEAETDRNCHQYQWSPKIYVWKLEFDFYDLQFEESPLSDFTQSVIVKLDRYLVARHIIYDKYPNTSIVMIISGGIWRKEDSPWKRFQSSRHPLYCNEQAGKFSTFYEAVLTWSRFHDITVILQENKASKYDNPVIWKRLESTNSFENEPPVYIRRSYNTSQVVGKWTKGGYPCINWSEIFPPSGIVFNHGYAGTTVDLSITKDIEKTRVTPDETKIFLLFALQRFSILEILTGQTTFLNELNMLETILRNPLLKRNLKVNGIKGKRISLEIPMSTTTLEEEKSIDVLTPLILHLQNINVEVDIQISVWKSGSNHLMSLLKNLRNIGSSHGVKISVGLTIPKCEDFAEILLNETESNVNKLKKVPFHLLDDIVCIRTLSIQLIKGSRSRAWFLEGCFFLQKLFTMFFSNLKNIKFRLNHQLDEFYDSHRNNEDTLKFLNDVNNFACSYKIPFILIPAFLSWNSSNDASWWEITNYTRLTDVTVYQDIQSKFQNKIGWRPTVLTARLNNTNGNINPTSNRIDMISWIALGIGFLFFGVAASFAYKIRKNSRLLSDEEVYEFLNGKKDSFKKGNDEVYSGTEGISAELSKLKFKPEYEIPCSHIHLDKKTILGSGTFGIVYKATLESDENVAVKMPYGSFSKETFLGMLSEVKLLCYVGTHDNLVKFIGCYTKEIRRGVVYVVMELCEKGSLKSHLGNMMNQSKHVKFLDLVRFCKDIASGMEYISSQRVIHGDLATRNVLLDSLNICKIGDFGLSRRLYEFQMYVKKSEEPLPWRWMAYESLKRLEFSTQSDVWSYGVTIWEIFSLGDIPYPGLSWTSDFVDQLGEGLRMTIPRFAPQEIFDIMEKCWLVDPMERPTFSELASFFSKMTPYESVISEF